MAVSAKQSTGAPSATSALHQTLIGIPALPAQNRQAALYQALQALDKLPKKQQIPMAPAALKALYSLPEAQIGPFLSKINRGDLFRVGSLLNVQEMAERLAHHIPADR